MIRTPQIRAQADSIRHLLDRLIGDGDLPTYVQGHMGRYACVVVSGFLENALAEVCCAYVADRAQPPVVAYTASVLRKIQNPKAAKFVETFGRFNKDWGLSLNDHLLENSERRKGAIDSIMTNRHLIAHGKNSNITLRQVKTYFEASIETIEFLESKF